MEPTRQTVLCDPVAAARSSFATLARFARFLRGRGSGKSKLAFPDKYQITDVYHRVGEIGQDADRVPFERP